MTTTPVSPQDVPARPWLTADAERWAAARLPAWFWPGWPALALPVAVVTAMALSPGMEVCTVSSPCGPQWRQALEAFLFFCHLGWLCLAPELALLSAPLLLAAMADPSLWTGGAGEKAADLTVIAVICWGWAAAALRLRVRRRQRRLALDAAGGLTFPVPAPQYPQRRGRVLMAIGLGLLAVCAAVSALSVHDFRFDEAKAASAAQVRAVVVGSVPDEAVYVRFTGGEPAGRHRIDAIYPERYPVDSTVQVLLNGDWMRLAAEPYRDLTDRQFDALVGGGLGGALLARGLFAASRSRALTRAPAPALRVMARRRGGRTQIYAADDAAGKRPFLSYEPYGGAGGRLREAVLYGVPHQGAEVALLSTTKSGLPQVETSALPTSQERPEPRPEHGPAQTQTQTQTQTRTRTRTQTRTQTWAKAKSDERRRARLAEAAKKTRQAKEAAQERVAYALVTLKPARAPVRWNAGPPGRISGAALLVAVAVGLTELATHYEHQSIWRWTVWLVGAGLLTNNAWTLLTWRVTADAAGLRAGRLGRTRHLPWEDIKEAVYTDDGSLRIRTRTGLDDLGLGTVGAPLAERLFRRRARAVRAAAEITAMVREPGLRPPSGGTAG